MEPFNPSPLSASNPRPARRNIPRRRPDDVRTGDDYLRAEWSATRNPVDRDGHLRGTKLLDFATDYFAWVIKPHGRTFELADVANAIWTIWNTPAFEKAVSPWSYTNTALTKQFSTRARQDRDRTGDLKRGYEPGSILFRSVGSEAIDLEEHLISAESDRRRAVNAQAPHGNSAAGHAVALLRHIGLDQDQADALVDFILQRAFKAHKAWYKVVVRELQKVRMLDIPVDVLKRTTHLLLGNTAVDHGTIELDEHLASAESDRRCTVNAETLHDTSAAAEAVALLRRIGLDKDQADAAADFILERAVKARQSCYDAVSRETQIVEMLDISVTVFKNTTSLLLGNSAGDLGTIEARHRRVPAQTVKNIVNSTRNLLREAPPSAWRDRQLAQADAHTAAAAKLRALRKSRAAGEAL